MEELKEKREAKEHDFQFQLESNLGPYNNNVVYRSFFSQRKTIGSQAADPERGY